MKEEIGIILPSCQSPWGQAVDVSLSPPFMQTRIPSSQASCPQPPPTCGPVFSALCPGLPPDPISLITAIDLASSLTPALLLLLLPSAYCDYQALPPLLSPRVLSFFTAPKYEFSLSQFPVLENLPWGPSELLPSGPATRPGKLPFSFPSL